MHDSVASVSYLGGELPDSVPSSTSLVTTSPDAGPQLPSRCLTDDAQHARCWWLGAHGGAGETTLAHLFVGVAAAEHRWPISLVSRTSVALVARTNFWGMHAAMAAMRDWSANHRDRVDVLGLVLIADRPGRLPRPLLNLQRHLEAGHDAVWQLPWVESWALGEIPSRENAPNKEVEALRRGLTAALRAARKERQDA